MSVYKRRSGRWTALIDLDLAPNGKRRRKSLGTFSTKKDAERAERDALNSRDRGIELAPATVTVGQLFDRFLADAKTRVGAKTLERYAEIAARNVLPRLGSIALAKLRPPHLAALYAELMTTGRADASGGLSARTVGHVHTLLHGVLAWAIRMELVGRNVADVVSPARAVRIEARALAVGEAQRLLETTKDHRMGPLFAVALATGLRRGEIVALRWRAIDMEASLITVRSTASHAFGAVTEKVPKSGRSRAVALSPLAVDALKTQKARQAQDRLAAGAAYDGTDFVFADPLGAAIHPRAVTSAFTRVSQRLGLSTTSFHALRHTCATWMIAAGIDVRTAAAVLGHASPTVTLAVYAHVIAGAQAAAVAAVDDRLQGIPSRPSVAKRSLSTIDRAD